MEYQTMEFGIIISVEMRTGNNEQIVKGCFGCYAEIENTDKNHTFSLLTCSNKYAINMSVRTCSNKLKKRK